MHSVFIGVHALLVQLSIMQPAYNSLNKTLKEFATPLLSQALLKSLGAPLDFFRNFFLEHW